MPLFNVNLPTIAGIFFCFIENIASFNIIPTNLFYDTYFNIDEISVNNALNNNFEMVGFKSISFLYNVGTIMLIILSVPALVIVLLIMKVLKKFSNKIHKKYN